LPIAPALPSAPGASGLPTDGWTEINVGGLLPEPRHERRPGGTRRRLVAIGASAAVLAGGLATMRLLRGQALGSPTPVAAVERLIHSLEQHDLLGAAETFPAYDRDLVAESVDQLTKTAASTPGDKIDLHAVSGYTLEVIGLQTESEPVTDRISLVTLTGGHYKATADLRSIYRMAKLDGLADQLDADQLMPSAEGDLATMDTPIRVATVHDDEGWHVSYAYTIAEIARRETGRPAPDPAQRIATAGVASPEQAARLMVDALAAGDWRRAIELTPNGEADVLHDYGHLLLDAAAPRQSYGTITKFETHTKTVRDHTVVVVDHVALDLDGNRVDVARDGSGCLTINTTVDGETSGPVRGCVDDLFASLRKTGSADSVRKLADLVRQSFDDGGFVTVEKGGKWYVSPYRTLSGALVIAAVGVSTYFGDGVGPIDSSSDSPSNANTSGSSDLVVPAAAQAAQANVRAAESVIAVVYDDGGSYDAVTDAALRRNDPLLFPGGGHDGISHGAEEISWTLTGPAGSADGVIVAARGADNVCYMMRSDSGGDVQFGRYDATTLPCRATGQARSWSDSADRSWNGAA